MSPEPDSLAPTLSDKIRARHCDRQAVVYVRQSTLRQIEHNLRVPGDRDHGFQRIVIIHSRAS